MIDLTQFKNKWLGNVIDYDHAAGYQCTDIVKEWLAENSGQSIGTMGNAIDWWNKPKSQLQDLCVKLDGSDAQPGDIVVKRPNHVGIATGGITGNQVEILEQNGSTGNGKGQGNDRIRTRWINRSDVAGLWRLKAQAGDTQIVINTGQWNVRDQPNLNGAPIRDTAGNKAPALEGQHYSAVIDSNGWARISFLNRTGYLGPKAYRKV